MSNSGTSSFDCSGKPVQDHVLDTVLVDYSAYKEKVGLGGYHRAIFPPAALLTGRWKEVTGVCKGGGLWQVFKINMKPILNAERLHARHELRWKHIHLSWKDFQLERQIDTYSNLYGSHPERSSHHKLQHPSKLVRCWMAKKLHPGNSKWRSLHWENTGWSI